MSRRFAWFFDEFGFDETDSYEENKSQFSMDGPMLVTKAGKRRYVGNFTTPKLADLKPPATGSRVSFKHETGDVRELIGDPKNDGCVFQVASQFNCLEMTNPSTTPEQGIGIYTFDHTQGPACSISCPAATAFRNYILDQGTIQLDMLSDVGRVVGNSEMGYWKMKNGYCIPKEAGSMAKLNRSLDSAAVVDGLRVGVHWSTSVAYKEHRVSQVFCSAMPVAYARHCPVGDWEKLGSAVLKAAYLLTLAVASQLAEERNERVRVYLTKLGCGVFGNPSNWIVDAVNEALSAFATSPIDVVLVHYGYMEPEWKMIRT